MNIERLTDLDGDSLEDLVAGCVAHLEMVERTMGAVLRMSDILPRRAEAQRAHARWHSLADHRPQCSRCDR